MEKKGKFDYILLETTGLADPGKRLVLNQNAPRFINTLTHLLNTFHPTPRRWMVVHGALSENLAVESKFT